MQARLAGPPPEEAQEFEAVLSRVLSDVLPFSSRTDHPGYFAFVPSFTTWPAALAELTAAATNPYCGAWMELQDRRRSSSRSWTGSALVGSTLRDPWGLSGGSHANLTALLSPASSPPRPDGTSVLLVSPDQAHSSLARTARAMGLQTNQLRVLPTDDTWRLAVSTVRNAVRADRAVGRTPFALCASAGSTNSRCRRPPGGVGRRVFV